MSTRKNTNPVERQKFAARLQTAIGRRGLNQTSFAKLLGVRQGHVNAWFAAKSMPSKLSMVIIAQALRIELGWLTAGAGPMELPEKNVDGAPISEPPVSYNALTEGDRVIVEIFKELIDSGDSDVLDHLRRQLTLLRELLERRRGRES